MPMSNSEPGSGTAEAEAAPAVPIIWERLEAPLSCRLVSVVGLPASRRISEDVCAGAAAIDVVANSSPIAAGTRMCRFFTFFPKGFK